MAINRVEVKDYLVFKGEFAADFCPGVNVFIGGNGTGKTTLLRVVYHYRLLNFRGDKTPWVHNIKLFDDKANKNPVFIPEKDILEHSTGLLTFIEQKKNGFSGIYRDVLISAMDSPTKTRSDIQERLLLKIRSIIHGEVRYDKGESSFYTMRDDGARVSFSNEASGYKKFGYLGLLIECGRLENGSVLFWDEPENSLNPELASVLVDILLELSRNGVQIFIATHSEILCDYFSVNRQKNDSVMFHSLYKDGENIKVSSSDRFDLLEPNKLTEEPVKLYEKELGKAFGNG